ncbi:aldo/keto reductase [Lactobacillus sp.]|uniref:aldo/keto reductase n=1 Tax=Lactobacillus sp. TaxID=1591 RepID=UPI003EF13263
MEYFTLNDGYSIPKLGFGTYKINGFQGVHQIRQAIENGYRLLDSASRYENEGALGRAIRESSVPRSELFVTSKLPGAHHAYKEAINELEEGLMRSGLDYFDLYLIHWPNPLEDHYVEAWQALADAQRFGLVRSIGVSNFEPAHLDRIIKETGVTPAVNQVELHPYWSSREVREYDDAHGIVTEAWSPLMRAGEVFEKKVIQDLAQKYGKHPAQVILRWETQLGVLPIPKASSSKHQLSNLDIFDFKLTDEEVEQITALDKPDGRRPDRNPNQHQEF